MSLAARECLSCGDIVVTSVGACPACGGRDLARADLSGTGEVYSATVVRVPPTHLADAAPYVIAMVRLREGPLVLGRWRGAGAPAIGHEVTVTQADDGVAVVTGAAHQQESDVALD